MLYTLTGVQEELLMECHEASILKQEPPLGCHYMKHLKPLLRLGLIMPIEYFKEGKNLQKFVITAAGIDYLERYVCNGNQ